MKKIITFLFFVVCLSSFSEEIPEKHKYAFYGNILLPGLLQLELDQDIGYFYLPATAFSFTSTILLANNEKLSDIQETLLLSVSTISNFVLFYSFYSYLHDISGTYKKNIPEMLSAPYDLNNFNILTCSKMMLSFAALYDNDDYNSAANYFKQNDIELYNQCLPPLGALSATLGVSMFTNLFIASTEEMVFRDIFLDDTQSSYFFSSILFGVVHLSNVFFLENGITQENLIRSITQSISATAAGFIYGYVTIQNDFDIDSAIYAHYWNNVIFTVTNFIVDNGKVKNIENNDENLNFNFYISPSNKGIKLNFDLSFREI